MGAKGMDFGCRLNRHMGAKALNVLGVYFGWPQSLFNVQTSVVPIRHKSYSKLQ